MPNGKAAHCHRPRRGPARALLFALCGAALVPLGAAPLHARPAAASAAAGRYTDPAVRTEIAERVDSDLRRFYAARGNRPLWLIGDAPSPAARLLIEQIETAAFDRLKPRKLKPDRLVRELERAESGSPKDLARAELALSEGFARYVKALRAAQRAEMIYETEALSPAVPTTTAALDAAAAAPSLERYVATMGWMHPLYAPLREALLETRYDEAQRWQIALNLDRVRALPANPAKRYVLVDAASARLWMYEDGERAGTMRVVVGKPETQTPMMAGFIRFAIVNPYWNVPEDLVRTTIAWNVLDKGPTYIRHRGYQVLSGWEEQADVLDPATIDWHAVEAGVLSPRVRQLPGGSNFMGSVKFMFPNPQGIYLHDTPDKHLLRKDERQFSSGCVRLEDAQRLGRWLLGKPLPRRQRSPEQRIGLPEPVPVYITYLTAMPEDGRIAFRHDVYGRDGGGDATRLARGYGRGTDRP